MDDGSPHNWTHRTDGQEFMIVAPLSRDCTDGTHFNYSGLFLMQIGDGLLSSVCVCFVWSSEIVAYHSHVRQVPLMLLLRPQEQTGR